MEPLAPIRWQAGSGGYVDDSLSRLALVFRATSARLTRDAQDGFCSLSLTPGRNDALSSGLRDHLPGKSLSATKSRTRIPHRARLAQHAQGQRTMVRTAAARTNRAIAAGIERLTVPVENRSSTFRRRVLTLSPCAMPRASRMRHGMQYTRA